VVWRVDWGGMARMDVAAVRAALEARHPLWELRTLSGALDAVAAEHPERAYVIGDGDERTYADVVAWSWRIARGPRSTTPAACAPATSARSARTATSS